MRPGVSRSGPPVVGFGKWAAGPPPGFGRRGVPRHPCRLINGSTLIGGGSPGSAASDWAVAQTGDYNNDGKSDILWRNTTTGQVLIWFINGTTTSGGRSAPSFGADRVS